MTDFRMSSFLIGLVGFSAIIALIMGLVVHTAAENSLDFNNESLAEYNKMQEMNALAQNLRDEDQRVASNSEFDLLGDLFTQGRATMTVTKSSIDVVQNMSEDATEDLNIGYSGKIVRNAAIVALIIMIMFLFIMIIIKWRA